MKHNEKGFSIVEILIVIVVVGLLGAVGWLVYDRQKDNTNNSETNTQTAQQDNVANKDSASSSEGQTSTPISAQTCSYVDVNNQESRNKKLTNAGITADAGSECVLNSGDTLLSFSQTTSTTNADGTINSAYKYGIVVVSGTGAAPKVNNTLACAKIPPDPSNPPVINAVADSKATLKCPGYEGATYTYDFGQDKFSKN
jgi:prepilin-type N-terminal cleavage/methylation domain-containing protein